VRIANLVTAGDYWRPISQRLAREAACEAADDDDVSVESYQITQRDVGGTSELSVTLCELRHVDAGLRAFDDGCDVLFVNATPDYGVPLLRASVTVPVVGAGEASMLAARSIGARFSIVTVWPPSSEVMYRRLLAQTGMGAHCASVIYALTDDDVASGRKRVYSAMEASEPQIIDRVEHACRRAFDDDGVDAVVLGCTCMHPIAEQLALRFDRPVIDPAVTGIRAAVQAGRLVPSGVRAGDGAPAAHRDAFRALMAGSVDVSVVAECDVCKVLAAGVPG
jgi:allantoin racemase